MPDREPTFEPDYGIEGPYNNGPFGVIDAIATRARRFVRWLVGFAIAVAVVWCMSFTAGALLCHFHLL